MPNVYLSHEAFAKSNAWAITPVLIDILNQLIKPHTRWFVLCEASSMVNLGKLLSSLDVEDDTKVRTKLIWKFSICRMLAISFQKFINLNFWVETKLKLFLLYCENALKTFLLKYLQEVYLGFPLFDRDATIIHHFAFFHNPSTFHYPYVRAGVAFSIPLLNR